MTVPAARPALRSAWFSEDAAKKQQGAAAIALLEAEKERKRALKHETWNKREKRKRELGQASRAGSFVEEEKRILRQSGVR